MLATGAPTTERIKAGLAAFNWLTHTHTTFSLFYSHYRNTQADFYSFAVVLGWDMLCQKKPSLSSPDGCAADSDKPPAHRCLLQIVTVQENGGKGREQKGVET